MYNYFIRIRKTYYFYS